MSRIPQPTPEELARWGRLAETGAVAAQAPRAPHVAFAQAFKAARQIVAPDGPPSRGNPFCRLHSLAARFLADGSDGRQILSGELAEVAEACRKRLAEIRLAEAPAARPVNRLPYKED